MLNTLKQNIRNLSPKFLIRLYHYLVTLIVAIIYRFPSREIYVIGITGTKGKSSTTELVNAILEEAGYSTALASTIRFKIGSDSQPNKLKMTMAGRGFLHKFLRQAINKGCTHAIVEMTSEGTLLYRHSFIDLDALIFTNLSPEHIESHGSYEKYVQAKLKIRDQLLKSKKKTSVIVVNSDDQESQRFLDAPIAHKLTFSLTQAGTVDNQPSGTSFSFKNTTIHTSLPGIFNVYNILGAATLADYLGVTPETIKQAISKFTGIPGRMDKVTIESTAPYPTIIVDYAHTTDSLTKAYEACGNTKLICVLGGTGGGRDKWKRPHMGEIADNYCHHIILTDEDPYDEDPKQIVNDIRTGIKNKPVEIIMDRRQAIGRAIDLATPTDTIIITGKGTDPYIMGPHGTKVVWSDKQVATEELYARITRS